MNDPNSKDQDDSGDTSKNQPRAIERLLGKPLLPLTEQRPYTISEETFPDLEAFNLLVQKKNAMGGISKN